MSDLIERQAAINEVVAWLKDCLSDKKNGKPLTERLRELPSAQPPNCEGCKHLGKWENEVEYGYPSPCTCCRRRVGIIMKDDTISRQAAIETTWEEPSFTDPLNVLTEVRDRLKALPPVHSDYDCVLKQFGDCTYDTTGCSDCVIKAKIKTALSAQPEIIRCNSCKHWTQSTGKMKGFGLGRCEFHDADLVTCNGFCYWAERRTDDER